MVSARLLDSGYARSRQSSGLSPKFTHFLRVDGLGYHVSTCSSFLAVTWLVSASPEEYKNWHGLGDGVTEMFPYSALCLARWWIHVHASVHGGSWDFSNIFQRKGELGGIFSRSPRTQQSLVRCLLRPRSMSKCECSDACIAEAHESWRKRLGKNSAQQIESQEQK